MQHPAASSELAKICFYMSHFLFLACVLLLFYQQGMWDGVLQSTTCFWLKQYIDVNECYFRMASNSFTVRRQQCPEMISYIRTVLLFLIIAFNQQHLRVKPYESIVRKLADWKTKAILRTHEEPIAHLTEVDSPSGVKIYIRVDL